MPSRCCSSSRSTPGLPLAGGFIGVDIFFVISGFVITTHAVAPDSSARRGFALRRFYTRARCAASYPPSRLLITVVALASPLFLSPLGRATGHSQDRDRGRRSSAPTSSCRRSPRAATSTSSAETNAFLHTWSLSVEEQFYLVFPAFLLGAWRISPGGSAPRRLCAAQSRGVHRALVASARRRSASRTSHP